jgi:hypothetical protein
MSFPWDMNQSLSLALYRTYAVPSIGRLLGHTAEFTERTQKRYDDTALILDTVLEHGLASEPGRAAIRRMNQMHGAYPISNDDKRSVLCTFVTDARPAGSGPCYRSAAPPRPGRPPAPAPPGAAVRPPAAEHPQLPRRLPDRRPRHLSPALRPLTAARVYQLAGTATPARYQPNTLGRGPACSSQFSTSPRSSPMTRPRP